MNKSWRDLSWIRLKCSVSIIFSTLTLFPTLHPSLCLTTSSNPRLLLNPVSQLCDTRVDTGLVPTSTALTPAHNAGLEPLPTLLETHQGASGVSLVRTVRGERLLDLVWMWEHDNYIGVKTYPNQPFVLLFLSGEHVARSHLACVNSSSQESAAEHPGSDLALRDHVTHCVVDDFHRCLLQQLCLLTCKSRTKGSALCHVTSVFITNIKGVNGLD